LLTDPPPVRSYRPGTWGPNAIHQLIAPNAWRLPFERTWRDPNFYEGATRPKEAKPK
jgi:glucose-6-phosphate 1-dehydrogenase